MKPAMRSCAVYSARVCRIADTPLFAHCAGESKPPLPVPQPRESSVSKHIKSTLTTLTAISWKLMTAAPANYIVPATMRAILEIVYSGISVIPA